MTPCKKLLIIDNSKMFRHTLKQLIRTSDTRLDINEAGTTEQAMMILDSDPPDLVIMDIAISGQNGIRFISAIKKAVPDSRIVVLTSHDSAEHRAASLKTGANDFLSKERNSSLRLMEVIQKAVHGTV
jgi:DNA-binding NarL/FixJ family response regulator